MKRLPALTALILCLAACGPVRTVFAPGASIQQLKIDTDGSWDVTLRLQNYGTAALRFGRIHATMQVGKQQAGTLDQSIVLELPSLSGDVAHLRLQPNADAAATLRAVSSGSIAYALHGTLMAAPPDDDLKEWSLDYQGYLSPVPGLAHVYR